MFVDIFGTVKWLRYLAWFGIVAMGAFYILLIINLAVLCAPSTGYGQADYFAALGSPSCMAGFKPNVIIGGAGNIVSDVFILVLPLPAIWQLHLPTAKKLGVTAIIMTGLACVIVSDTKIGAQC